MIVVIVTDEHDIDAGKIFPTHAGVAAAAWPERGEGASSLRPDRVRQDVDVLLLDEQRGVVDEGNAQLVTFQGTGWL